MILFFKTPSQNIIATEVDHKLSKDETNELCWLYGNASLVDAESLDGYYVGPRREMITPWSTNAVEITQNMALKGISRIEEYFPVSSMDAEHDPMLQLSPFQRRRLTICTRWRDSSAVRLPTLRYSVSLRSTLSIAVTRFSAVRSSSTARRRSQVSSR